MRGVRACDVMIASDRTLRNSDRTWRNLERRAKAIIFDLDGVLIDSWRLTQDAFAHAFSTVVADAPPPIDEYRRHLGAPLREILALMGLPGEMEPVFRRYSSEHAATVPVFPGILELLDGLRGHGYRLAVLTGKDAPRTAQILELTGLSCFFRVVVTPNHAPGKPDPASVHACAVGLGLGLDELPLALVGDSRIDMETARNAGVAAVFARWGALNSLRRTHYDTAIERPGELLELFP